MNKPVKLLEHFIFSHFKNVFDFKYTIISKCKVGVSEYKNIVIIYLLLNHLHNREN